MYGILLILFGLILFFNPDILIRTELYVLDGNGGFIGHILIYLFSIFIILKGIDNIIDNIKDKN